MCLLYCIFLVVCTDLYRGSMEQSHGGNPLGIDITHPFEGAVDYSGGGSHLLPPPGFRADQYTLIRLPRVEGRNILETLDANIGTVNEAPNIVELSDLSWEICILKSHCRTVQGTLGKIFPGSDVDLNWNPLEPTANDLELWGYDEAKRLRQTWFSQRAIIIIKDGWPAAAACYAYFLEELGST
jgi:hypothetical protein